MAETLVRRGRLAAITVKGRRSGIERSAYVGRAVGLAGGVFVGAGDASRQWAQNLQVERRCRLRVRGEEGWYAARELTGEERQRAVDALQPRGGGGRAAYTGPVFELRLETPTAVAS